MSNSALVNYTKLSPNNTSPRNHPIDTITIHCVGGNASVEKIGDIFYDKSNESSSNYGVDSNGNVGLYVNESDRSWCTSSSSNDHRAVTIEVANDGPGPEWHVSDKAMDKLIELVTDICERNDIKQLLWKNDKQLIGQTDKQNMTIHRWFKNKECPGNYLLSKHYYIASEVNKRLGVKPATSDNDDVFTPYVVGIKANALNVRKGPGTSYPITTTLINDRNKYTIVAEEVNPDGTVWCKLKSGIGWISKKYTK